MFTTTCFNYWQMEQQHFDDKNHFIWWVLQLVEGDAGPWAHRQLTRMEQEQVGGRVISRELRRIEPFFAMFNTHFGDEGLAERDHQRWVNGIKQKGKAVTYFQEVKEVMIWLGYDCASLQTLDQVFTGLKAHNRTHFIGRRWASFNKMKSAVILYDAGHWAIHSTDWGSTPGMTMTRPWDLSSQYTRGKSLTPQMAGVSKIMGRKLTDSEWKDCKENWLCFQCFREGKRIQGAAWYHPNHKKPACALGAPAPKTPARLAIMSAEDSAHISDVESDCYVSRVPVAIILWPYVCNSSLEPGQTLQPIISGSR